MTVTTFTCETCGWMFPLEQVERNALGNPICRVCSMPPKERAEMEQQVESDRSMAAELSRLHDGIGTPDELADDLGAGYIPHSDPDDWHFDDEFADNDAPMDPLDAIRFD